MPGLTDEARDVLAGRAFAHLATVLPDGAPHSVPIWIGVDGDRLVMFTQSGSRKARNIEADARVAISAVDDANPYRQCDLRGRVSERIDGEAAQAVADELSMKYTGAPFPWRSPNTVAYVITPQTCHTAELPFAHEAR
jgi:PPOX class probable F420-dependent enzyme